MGLTLKMVDEVIERTSCSYKEAKEALLETDGDILEAIIKVESKGKKHEKVAESVDKFTSEFTEKVKELIEKGDVNRIIIEKNDKVVMDIPVNAGLIGAVVFAPAAITALIVALGTGHSVKMVKESGEVIDLKEFADKTVNVVKEKAAGVKGKATEAKEKATEVKGKAKGKAAEVKGKATEVKEKIKKKKTCKETEEKEKE